jgi:hypothetical protein
MSPKKTPDRDGYTVTEQGGGAVQVTYAVTHDESGVGLGAFVDDAEIDAAIAEHSQYRTENTPAAEKVAVASKRTSTRKTTVKKTARKAAKRAGKAGR